MQNNATVPDLIRDLSPDRQKAPDQVRGGAGGEA